MISHGKELAFARVIFPGRASPGRTFWSRQLKCEPGRGPAPPSGGQRQRLPSPRPPKRPRAEVLVAGRGPRARRGRRCKGPSPSSAKRKQVQHRFRASANRRSAASPRPALLAPDAGNLSEPLGVHPPTKFMMCLRYPREPVSPASGWTRAMFIGRRSPPTRGPVARPSPAPCALPAQMADPLARIAPGPAPSRPWEVDRQTTAARAGLSPWGLCLRARPTCDPGEEI